MQQGAWRHFVDVIPPEDRGDVVKGLAKAFSLPPRTDAERERLVKAASEIVKRSDQVTGFQVLPRRWVVERTFAGFGRNRRLANDFEATLTSSEAWLYLASVQLLALSSCPIRLQAIDAPM